MNLYNLEYKNHKNLIIEALRGASDLRLKELSPENFVIEQVLDRKIYKLPLYEITDVFPLSSDKSAVQVNLRDNKKILITSSWIGFAPHMYSPHLEGLVSDIVTTKDLKNIMNAMKKHVLEEGSEREHELYLLDGLFFSVLEGGEQIGFDLSQERRYFQKIIEARPKFSY